MLCNCMTSCQQNGSRVGLKFKVADDVGSVVYDSRVDGVGL